MLCWDIIPLAHILCQYKTEKIYIIIYFWFKIYETRTHHFLRDAV